jgi:hypothetical protein
MSSHESRTSCNGSGTAILVALFLGTACAPAEAHDEPVNTPPEAYKLTGTTLLELWGRKEDYGAWNLPPLPPLADRMQTVHLTLLPDGKYGKLLIVNGSSFRIKYNPGKTPGTPFEEGVDGTDPYVVDHSALYDPALDLADDGLTPLGRNGSRLRRPARTPCIESRSSAPPRRGPTAMTT